MVKWLNHVAVAAPRNGSTTHTVSPSSGVVVAGTAFTPSAGNLLVCVVEGAVTSSTPTGWTLPSGGSAVNNTGLYVWHRVAAGADTFSTTHNGSNYPVVFDIYEFPAGSAFLAAASAVGVSAASGAGPSLSGLTAAANFRAGVVGQTVSNGLAPGSFTWSVGTEAVDTTTPYDVNDGYTYSLTYAEDLTGATWSAAATGANGGNTERLVFAVSVPAEPSTNPLVLQAAVPRPTSMISTTGRNPAALQQGAPRVTGSLQVAGRNSVALASALSRPAAEISIDPRNPLTIQATVPRVHSTLAVVAVVPTRDIHVNALPARLSWLASSCSSVWKIGGTIVLNPTAAREAVTLWSPSQVDAPSKLKAKALIPGELTSAGLAAHPLTAGIVEV